MRDTEVEYGTAYPVAGKETVNYNSICEFYGISDTGNPCDVEELKNNRCVETACNSMYEMGTNGKCQECNRPHASGYAQTGNCIVTQCDDGYHPYGDSCVRDEIDCTNTIEHAETANIRWNSTKGMSGVCTVEACESGYHIESNACIPDERTCVVEHGIGTQEWIANKWTSCVVTSCNAGYISDDKDSKCIECDNKYVGTDLAVSSYARECEIASCMYQGEKYKLDGNECIPICAPGYSSSNPYIDSEGTGSMYWDESQKKCVRTCQDGYIPW